MSRFLRLSLRTNFLILTTALILINSLIMSSYYLYYEKKHRYRDLASRARILVRDLARSSLYGLATGDRQSLDLLLKSLLRERDLSFAFVAEDSGRIIAHVGIVPGELALAPRELKEKFFLIRQWKAGKEKFLVSYALVKAPFGTGDEEDLLGVPPQRTVQLGYVAVGLSYWRIRQDLKHIRNTAGLLTLSVNLVAILVAYIFSLYVSSPLKKLTVAARSISRGVDPGLINNEGGGEIGELTQAFNTMLGEIQRSRKQLETYTRSLEERVKERTIALEQSVQELQRAYEELKRIHDIKAQFIQTASHELRTPLTAIKANVDFILQYEKEDLTTDHREILEAIQRNVNQMHKMVEDMLALVRLEERSDLDRENINLKEQIEECLLELSSLRGQRKVVLDIPKEMTIFADPDRLHAVFVNLLSNAFRFTDNKGQVIIKAEKGTGFIRLEIQDNGVGIPEEHLDRVFEPFYQADRSRGGTGLGLAIVKRIVEGHGGSITVSSSAEGTSFVIVLPDEATGEGQSR